MNAPWLRLSLFNHPRAAAGHEKEQGPHRSATPESMQMFHIAKAVTPQPQLHFIREGFTTFTPAQAGLVMRECLYEKQRKIDRIHALTLRELMTRGQWAAKDKIDFAQLPDGRLLLVNGNHRMTAQAASKADIEWTVVIHHCPTMADVQALYYRFDTNIRKRSDNDIIDGIDFAEMVGLNNKTARALFAACPIIANGLRAGGKSDDDGLINRRIVDERIAMARVYAPAARAWADCIASAPTPASRKMHKAGVAAVAIVTFHHQPINADMFWRGLAKNDGLRRGDPRSTLLLDMAARNGTSGSAQQTIVAAAKAWGAFCEGRQLKVIKVNPGHRVPVVGTPYTVSA